MGLTITLVAYQAAYWIYRRANFNPLANPVAIAIALLITALTLTGMPYPSYFEGAQFVHFLLGPATVALAVPLYTHFNKLRRMLFSIFGALVAGVCTAVISSVGIAWILGASRETLLSLAPKSVTMAIAMGITEKVGGLPSLTAVLVISTGIFGAVVATGVLNALKIKDYSVRGFAVGVAAHGIGTARAFQVNEEAGAFAGLAMGLNGLMTALLLPILISSLGLI
jgi:predicted murein hydrolase (TIGR00659 family)